MNAKTLRMCSRCFAALPEEATESVCEVCRQQDTRLEPSRTLPATEIEKVQRAFPNFEIVQVLGAGGMGTVYLARQPKLQRFAALKIMDAALAAKPEFAERFKREAQALARMNHPEIVTIYDFGEAGGFFYILMEYGEGNLRQAMKAGSFEAPVALTLVARICAGLQCAHEQGILHRDIKPENILLDAKGRVKIADFGIAKWFGEQNQALTATGSAVGTPQYMAPEQLETPNQVDARADIYAVGVVLYEMLTGELPLGKFSPPSHRQPALDPRIDAVVLRALEKDRTRRFQSAAEMQASVEALQQSSTNMTQQRPAAQEAKPDFILCNPRLPRMAQAITVYGILIAPVYWMISLNMPESKLSANAYAAFIQALTRDLVNFGDLLAVLATFLGGLTLRSLRGAGWRLLLLTFSFHLLLVVLGVAGFIFADTFTPSDAVDEMSLQESIHTSLGLVLMGFEFASMVWLWRNRAQLRQICHRAKQGA